MIDFVLVVSDADHTPAIRLLFAPTGCKLLHTCSASFSVVHLRKEKLEREIHNFTQAIAEGGPSKCLLCEIATREKKISSITDRLLASAPDSTDTRVEDLKREVENGTHTLGSLLRKNAPLTKQELHGHLLGVQMYPALDGEGWCYFAEGTWDLMGNAPVAKDFMQPQNGRFVLVAGGGFEPPTFGL